MPSKTTFEAWVDEAGCTRSDGQANYEWDVLDRLRSVSRGPDGAIRSDFGRDVFGRVSWIRDARGTRDLVWDGLTLLEERDAETHEVLRAYAASGFTQGGARYYYLRDPLGSVVGLMDQNNDVVKTWIYDAWGFRALSWQAEGMEEVEPAIGYAGYLQHEESGLCLMPARAYSPALRRWLSRDPIGLAGGDTNLYGYVGGDPANQVDPSGLFDEPTTKVALIASGTALLGIFTADPWLLGLAVAILLGPDTRVPEEAPNMRTLYHAPKARNVPAICSTNAFPTGPGGYSGGVYVGPLPLAISYNSHYRAGMVELQMRESDYRAMILSGLLRPDPDPAVAAQGGLIGDNGAMNNRVAVQIFYHPGGSMINGVIVY